MASVKDKFDTLSSCIEHGVLDMIVFADKLRETTDLNIAETHIALKHSEAILRKVQGFQPE